MKYDFFASSKALNGFLVLVGAIGAYHMITDLLQVPKWGLRNATNVVASFYLRRELRRRGISWLSKSDFGVTDGKISQKSFE